jgi:hypothetical protein
LKFENVYISSVSFRTPGISSSSELYNLINSGLNRPGEWIQKEFKISHKNRITTVSLLDLHAKSKDVEFMPKKSDAKVMRPDIIASAICAQELVQGISPEKLNGDAIAFYMANGFCLDRLSDTIDEMCSHYFHPDIELLRGKENFDLATVKNQALDRFTPPLFVLNALTNAAQSFGSQYGGFYGDNATLGNTSQSGFYSIEQGANDIESGATHMAVIGGSNGVGRYSGITHQGFCSGNLLESEGSGFLLLESGESLAKRGAKPLAKLNIVLDSKEVPSIFKPVSYDKKFIINNKISESVIFSGAFSKESHEELKLEVESNWNNQKSLFPYWGNLGVAQNNLDIALAVETLKRDAVDRIDCFNRDLFGRQSIINIGSCL